MTIQIFLLGHFKLISQDRVFEHFSSFRAENLIAYLATHPDTAVKRQFLAFQLWPDSNEAQALTNLRKLLYILRHDLPDINTLLMIEHETIRIASDVQVDANEFHNMIGISETQLQTGDMASAIQSLTRAIQIYRGDLLSDCYDEWVIVEREILAQKYLRALTRLADLYDAQSNPQDAIFTMKLLIARDPLQELAYQKLMTLYGQVNDRVAALHTYHACVTVLQRELGVSPSFKTSSLYNELLTQNDFNDRQEIGSIPLPQIGRRQELDTLKQAWRQMIQSGRVRLVLIAGESGIGKTHLAETMVNAMKRQGIQTYNSRCYPGEGSLSFSPLIKWIRSKDLDHLDPKMRLEISRLLPEVLSGESTLPSQVDEKERRYFLFEAILAALTQPAEAQLFFMDDIQYCDRDTLEWLHFFIRSEIKTHTMVIATCRSEEINQNHALLSMLYSIRRIGNCLDELHLKPLTREETDALAQQLSSQPLAEPFLRDLYQNSEGNPLFVTELMRACLGQDSETSSHTWMIPPKVKLVIDFRLDQLSPLGLKLAGMAAVIGRDFELSLLQAVSDLAEDRFLDGLDELWRHGILHQKEGSRYSFSHNLIRESAYFRVNSARRQWLHRKVASNLESLASEQPGPLDVLIAGHYEAGNSKDQARRAYVRAARNAQSIFSVEEAIRLSRKGASLNLDGTGKVVDRNAEIQIQELLGELLLVDGQHEEARKAFLAAIAATDEDDELTRSRLLERCGAILPIEYRYDESGSELVKAEGLISRGLYLVDKSRTQIWIQIQLDRMWGNFVINRPDAMAQLAEQLHQPIDKFGTPVQQGQYFENLVAMELRRSRYVLRTPDALSHAMSAVKLFRRHEDLNHLPFALFEVGFCAMWSGWLGDYDQAEAEMIAALHLAERIGDKLTKARCLSYLLTLYRRYHRQELFERILPDARSAAWDMRHMGEFAGVVEANLAWYAYAHMDPQGSFIHFKSALQIIKGFPLQQLFFPFLWIGYFPAVAVASTQGDLLEAESYIRFMLEPSQQILHPDVSSSLNDAHAALKNQNEDGFYQHLNEAVELAHDWGYL
jgi:DNA-binding SARP family transcriptional activator